jgi:predicted PurR-regulated permease PerM
MRHATLHFKTFLWLLLVVSIGFAWLLLPFYGAVFWGTVLSIIFSPIQRRLVVRFGNRPTLAALTTLLFVLIIVIIPLLMITGGLVQEGALIYQQIKTGDLNFGLYFQQAVDALPQSIHSLLTRFDLTDIVSLQAKLSAGAMQGSQFLATKAFSIGQDTFQFVISFGIMMYLLFFLLRDGPHLARRIRNTIPLSEDHKLHLLQKFTTVIRATVKGNIVVAIAQGALGGLIFWILGIQGALLWGTMMAFLSLLPAIGAALIWGPVAIYFLLTGAIWKGGVLILFCVLVIGVVDNVLRPILVGKDTQMPDYVVLIATLGGMALFGINGFVIGPVIAALFMASWDLFGSTRDPSRD